MDHDRFDGLTRSLGAAASRRGFGRALAGGGLGTLLGSAFGSLAVDAKQKRHTKKKKKDCQRNCNDRTCGSDGCGGSCGACAANQICRGGTCCVPESVATTCAGRCGTWTNNCGQPVTCPTCPTGQECLGNGSCAQACGSGVTCPSYCTGCSVPNTEGATHCVAGNHPSVCPTQTCSSTADCPTGKQCQMCQGSGRCFVLCPIG